MRKEFSNTTSRRRAFLPLSALAIATAFALAGCNRAGAPAAAAPPPVPAEAPPELALPEGSGCSGAIARYRAILDNDLAMGHVDSGVYDQIKGELAEAASACAAGREAQAAALIRASKARHGYRG